MCRLVVLLFALSIAAGGCKDASEAPKADEPKKTEKKTKAEEPSGPSQAEVDKSKAEFQAYQNKAKTTEAMDQLDKIYKGAAAYFSTPRFSQLGEEIPCQFPASVPATPSPKGCADAAVDKDGDGRCDPDFAT